MKNQTKNTLTYGVIVLTAANLLVKVIGLVFKIPIQGLIHDEGMGYFNVAYTIYSWLYLLSTAGLPVALSVMISGERAKGELGNTRTVFSTALSVFALIGAVGALSMMIFARDIAAFVEVENAYLCALAISPTLFFICISSAVRGYFQGLGIMTVTAASQVIESVGKMAFGLLFASYSVSQGHPLYVTAAFAISGVSIGTFASMIYCLVSKGVLSPKATTESNIRRSSVLKKLVSIALPITVSSSVMGLMNVIDTVIAPSRLQDIGYTATQATEIYGNYTTLAVSLFNMPTVLVYPIAYAVVPKLTEILTLGKDGRGIITSSIKTTSVISLPCAVGLGVLSLPILDLIFPENSALLASPMLTMLAPSVFFCAVLGITNSILQASGNEKLPIISMIAGVLVKFLSSYILIGVDGIGRFGIPAGTCLCYLTAITLNFTFMCRKTKTVPNMLQVFVKPALCAALCGVAAYTVNGIMPNTSFSVFVPILTAVLVYALSIFKSGTIDADDIIQLPKGEKLCTILKRIKFIK